MRVVNCKRRHIAAIKPQAEQLCEMVDGVEDIVDPTTLSMFAKTILSDDGRPIAVMGIVPVMARVATAWAIISDEAVERHGPLLTIVAKRGLAKAASLGTFRRIDVMVRSDFDRAVEWAIDLGFEVEGLKRNYGPEGNMDYIELAMLIDMPEAA